MNITRGKLPGARKVCVYGVEGIGKSTFASKFPDPLFIDTEGGTKELDVARLDKPTSWTMLMQEVQYVTANPGCCKTLVIDTIDWAEQLCIEHICSKHKKDGLESFAYGSGYIYEKEEFGRLLNQLEDVISAGIHVVLSAHAQIRKFEQPDENGAYDRWELKLGKKTSSQISPLVKEWADLLLFANYKTLSVAADDKGKKFKAQGGRRVMYAAHHPCWDAKNRLGLPDELPLDYAPLAPYFEIGAPPLEQDTSADGGTKPEEVARPHATPPKVDSGNAPPPVQGSSALTALRDLMKSDGILDYAVQAAVEARGYYPPQTPLENMDEDFIRGVLVGAWPAVRAWIAENKPLPF